jgi:hypothetical protein
LLLDLEVWEATTGATGGRGRPRSGLSDGGQEPGGARVAGWKLGGGGGVVDWNEEERNRDRGRKITRQFLTWRWHSLVISDCSTVLLIRGIAKVVLRGLYSEIV